MTKPYYQVSAQRPEWARQDSPKAQQVCILMGLEGNIACLEMGIVPSPKMLENLQLLLQYLKDLTPYMPEKWTNENCPPPAKEA